MWGKYSKYMMRPGPGVKFTELQLRLCPCSIKLSFLSIERYISAPLNSVLFFSFTICLTAKEDINYEYM